MAEIEPKFDDSAKSSQGEGKGEYARGKDNAKRTALLRKSKQRPLTEIKREKRK